MFLPMSWTSPFTVAIRIFPAELRPPVAPAAFSASMKGSSTATACFITRADFTTCGKNILPEPKRSPTTFMPAISGPSITSSGRLATRRASSVSASTKSVMPLTRACSQPLGDGRLAPGEVLGLGRLSRALERLREGEQAFGAVRPPVEHDILAGFAQLRLDLAVDGELPRVDDAHVHAGLDGVVEEYRVHRLAHLLVPPEREG